MIAPHEPQALKNHCDQTLQRLAQRGGLSACETIAVLHDRKWMWMDVDTAHEMLADMVRRWQTQNDEAQRRRDREASSATET